MEIAYNLQPHMCIHNLRNKSQEPLFLPQYLKQIFFFDKRNIFVGRLSTELKATT